MAQMRSESFWFVSQSQMGRVAEAFRSALEAHNGMRQKMAGGVSFERPTGSSDPFESLSHREPDFHVVGVVAMGRLETSVPIGLHLRLWQEEGGVLGEIEAKWFGALMGSAARKWLERAVDGMRKADSTIRVTQPR